MKHKIGSEMNQNNLNNIVLSFLVIEEITNHRIYEGKVQYQIKWKGCGLKTWLSIKFISPSSSLLRYYCKIIGEINDQFPTLPLLHKAEMLFTLLSEATEQEINDFVKQHLTINGLKLPCSRRDTIMQRLIELIKYRVIPSVTEMKEIREKIIEEKVLELRQNQLEILKKFECEINLISDNSQTITVENIVDLEVPPSDFVYVNNYFPGTGVKIPDDSPIGCECSKSNGCAWSKKKIPSEMCCPDISGTQPAYDEKKRVTFKESRPIYECNKKCLCDRSCPNRVVQNGGILKLEIFRSFNGCGWGVRARQQIISGTFVARYVGEVITYDEAEKRNKDYLFDIDFNYATDTDLCPYTVDAKKYGNITRFINHSCNPNLSVFGVLIDCLDPDLHEIAFFASRDIEEGEELSFDYHKLMTCKCGSINCKLK